MGQTNGRGWCKPPSYHDEAELLEKGPPQVSPSGYARVEGEQQRVQAATDIDYGPLGVVPRGATGVVVAMHSGPQSCGPSILIDWEAFPHLTGVVVRPDQFCFVNGDCPGVYVLTHDAIVTPDRHLSPENLGMLPAGTTANVVEVVHCRDAFRWRGRLEAPTPGWISLLSTQDGFRWAERQRFLGHPATLPGNEQVGALQGPPAQYQPPVEQVPGFATAPMGGYGSPGPGPLPDLNPMPVLPPPVRPPSQVINGSVAQIQTAQIQTAPVQAAPQVRVQRAQSFSRETTYVKSVSFHRSQYPAGSVSVVTRTASLPPSPHGSFAALAPAQGDAQGMYAGSRIRSASGPRVRSCDKVPVPVEEHQFQSRARTPERSQRPQGGKAAPASPSQWMPPPEGPIIPRGEAIAAAQTVQVGGHRLRTQ